MQLKRHQKQFIWNSIQINTPSSSENRTKIDEHFMRAIPNC